MCKSSAVHNANTTHITHAFVDDMMEVMSMQRFDQHTQTNVDSCDSDQLMRLQPRSLSIHSSSQDNSLSFTGSTHSAMSSGASSFDLTPIFSTRTMRDAEATRRSTTGSTNSDISDVTGHKHISSYTTALTAPSSAHIFTPHTHSNTNSCSHRTRSIATTADSTRIQSPSSSSSSLQLASPPSQLRSYSSCGSPSSATTPVQLTRSTTPANVHSHSRSHFALLPPITIITPPLSPRSQAWRASISAAMSVEDVFTETRDAGLVPPRFDLDLDVDGRATPTPRSTARHRRTLSSHMRDLNAALPGYSRGNSLPSQYDGSATPSGTRTPNPSLLTNGVLPAAGYTMTRSVSAQSTLVHSASETNIMGAATTYTEEENTNTTIAMMNMNSATSYQPALSRAQTLISAAVPTSAGAPSSSLYHPVACRNAFPSVLSPHQFSNADLRVSPIASRSTSRRSSTSHISVGLAENPLAASIYSSDDHPTAVSYRCMFDTYRTNAKNATSQLPRSFFFWNVSTDANNAASFSFLPPNTSSPSASPANVLLDQQTQQQQQPASYKPLSIRPIKKSPLATASSADNETAQHPLLSASSRSGSQTFTFVTPSSPSSSIGKSMSPPLLLASSNSSLPPLHHTPASATVASVGGGADHHRSQMSLSNSSMISLMSVTTSPDTTLSMPGSPAPEFTLGSPQSSMSFSLQPHHSQQSSQSSAPQPLTLLSLLQYGRGCPVLSAAMFGSPPHMLLGAGITSGEYSHVQTRAGTPHATVRRPSIVTILPTVPQTPTE